ncbi:hypothetical protein M407DRAFT_222084 [Tulasnella calospora MUT 4182]|uniref:Uncharacterized protein n=1 Tax=Tulasnella calospora MUT 4182 TaxID=1051891 RepID=A0A0C3LAQ3_9AGAM|nr:hypothetical protein M407DRAFT_222084 [Tulasnella calospora MUT 4182]
MERFGPWKARLYDKLHFGVEHGHDGPQKLTMEDEEQIWDARAACWMLEVTSKFEDQLIVAQSIFSLDRAACILIARNPLIWRRLLLLTVNALRTWWDQPTSRNRYVVEQFGAALCHLLLAYPRTDERWREVAALIPTCASQSGTKRLYALDFAIHGYWYLNGLNIEGIRECLAQTDHSLAVVVLRCLINNDEYAASDYVSSLIKRPHDDTILALLALLVMKPRSPSNLGRPLLERDTMKLQDEELVWDALTGRNIEPMLTKALLARAAYIFYREEELCPRTGPLSPRPENRSRDLELRADEAEIFTAIMRRTKDLAGRDNADRSFVEHWKGAFNAFIVQINPGPPAVDEKAKNALFHFAVEAMSTSKKLFGMLESGWDEKIIEGYWRVLDWTMLTRPRSQEGRELARARIDEAIMWMFGKNQPGYAFGLPNHPQIIAYITTRLKDDSASESWLTDSMLISLCRMFTPAEWEPTELIVDPSIQKSTRLCHSSCLAQLAEEVRKHRPASFFISRNIDVVLNRICGYCERRIDWSYSFFEVPDIPTPRPSIIFVENGLL